MGFSLSLPRETLTLGADVNRRREGMNKGRERDNGHRKRVSPI